MPPGNHFFIHAIGSPATVLAPSLRNAQQSSRLSFTVKTSASGLNVTVPANE